MKKISIKSEDFQKYYRQLILRKIGVSGQKKIFKAKVLIIGAGGLGCPLILYLAYSGVGNLGIVDDDKVELSNLSRQVLFIKKDRICLGLDILPFPYSPQAILPSIGPINL